MARIPGTKAAFSRTPLLQPSVSHKRQDLTSATDFLISLSASQGSKFSILGAEHPLPMMCFP